MKREPRRWRTQFGSWVRGRGVRRLVTELNSVGQPVTEKAVYDWLSGRRTPRMETGAAIASISRGRVGPRDIVRHRALVNRRPPETPQG